MIIGFDLQKRYFLGLVERGELSHAYIFTGPDAIGKKKFALELAANAVPALQDARVVEPDREKALGTISIDQVRDLAGFLATTPSFGRYKFVIIDDAHRLTDDAANALLKSVEEPYRTIVWILVTHQPDLLPSTIRSRCQNVRFLPQGDAAVLELPGVKRLTAKDREMVRALAQGRVGLAMNMATSGRVAEARQAVVNWEKLPSFSTLDRLAYAKALAQEGRMPEVVSWWLAWVRARLPAGSAAARKLLALLPTLQQSQFNHRLAIESFLLGL